MKSARVYVGRVSYSKLHSRPPPSLPAVDPSGGSLGHMGVHARYRWAFLGGGYASAKFRNMCVCGGGGVKNMYVDYCDPIKTRMGEKW